MPEVHSEYLKFQIVKPLTIFEIPNYASFNTSGSWHRKWW